MIFAGDFMDEKKGKYSILGLSLFGILLASYITYFKYHIDTTKVGNYACDISEKLSCSKVYVSEYNNIFGIPVSVYGIVFYTLLFLSMLIWTYSNINDSRKKIIHSFVHYWLVFGLVFSAYLTFYIEMVLIKAYCIYCLISATNILLMYLLYLRYLKK